MYIQTHTNTHKHAQMPRHHFSPCLQCCRIACIYISACIYIYIYIQTHTYTHRCRGTSLVLLAELQDGMHIYMYVYMSICIYIHIHTNIHKTHTDAEAPLLALLAESQDAMQCGRILLDLGSLYLHTGRLENAEHVLCRAHETLHALCNNHMAATGVSCGCNNCNDWETFSDTCITCSMSHSRNSAYILCSIITWLPLVRRVAVNTAERFLEKCRTCSVSHSRDAVCSVQ